MAYYDAPFDSSPNSPFHSTNTTHTPSFPDYPSYLPPPYSTTSTPYAYQQQHHPYSPYIPTHNPYTSTHSFPPFPSQQQPPPSSNPYTTYSTSYASQQYTSQQHSHISDLQKSIEQIRDVDDYYKALQHSLTASMKENLQEMRESLADFSKNFRVVLQKKLQQKHEEELEEHRGDEEEKLDVDEFLIAENSSPFTMVKTSNTLSLLPKVSISETQSSSILKSDISCVSKMMAMGTKASNRCEQIFPDASLLPLSDSTTVTTILVCSEFFGHEQLQVSWESFGPQPPPKPPPYQPSHKVLLIHPIHSPPSDLLYWEESKSEQSESFITYWFFGPHTSLIVFVFFLPYFPPSDSPCFCKAKSQPLATSTICVLLGSDQSDAILSPTLVLVRTNKHTTSHMLSALTLNVWLVFKGHPSALKQNTTYFSCACRTTPCISSYYFSQFHPFFCLMCQYPIFSNGMPLSIFPSLSKGMVIDHHNCGIFHYCKWKMGIGTLGLLSPYYMILNHANNVICKTLAQCETNLMAHDALDFDSLNFPMMKSRDVFDFTNQSDQWSKSTEEFSEAQLMGIGFEQVEITMTTSIQSKQWDPGKKLCNN